MQEAPAEEDVYVLMLEDVLVAALAVEEQAEPVMVQDKVCTVPLAVVAVEEVQVD